MPKGRWWKRSGKSDEQSVRATFTVEFSPQEADELTAMWRATSAERARTLGAEHPETLRARFTVGFAELLAGRPTEAEAVLRPLLAAFERVFGPEQPETVNVRSTLARALADQNRDAEAERLFRSALAATEPDSEMGIEVRRALVEFLDRRERFGEAVPLQQDVLAKVEREAGRNHADTVTEQGRLADLLRLAGRPAEAMPIYRDALAGAEQVLGRDNMRTMNIRTLLAQLAMALDDPEAEHVQRGVIADQERQNGPDSPGALVARNNLANLLRDRGQSADAEAEYRALIADHRRVLGPTHPGTLITIANLGQLLRDSGRRGEAMSLFRELLPVAEDVLGPDHPVTRDARRVAAG